VPATSSPALHRQLLHLHLIDVAADRGGGHVDERRLSGHGDRLLKGRDCHLHVDGGGLADEQGHPRPVHRAEARQFRGQPVSANARRNAENAVAIGDADERIPGRLMGGGDGNAGQYTPGRVGHGTGEYGFLCVANRGKRNKRAGDQKALHKMRGH